MLKKKKKISRENPELRENQRSSGAYRRGLLVSPTSSRALGAGLAAGGHGASHPASKRCTDRAPPGTRIRARSDRGIPAKRSLPGHSYFLFGRGNFELLRRRHSPPWDAGTAEPWKPSDSIRHSRDGCDGRFRPARSAPGAPRCFAARGPVTQSRLAPSREMLPVNYFLSLIRRSKNGE